jgi:hypothetical protein
LRGRTAIVCAAPATILSSTFLPAGASKTSAERRSSPLSRLMIRERIRHAVDHFAERAPIDPDMSRQIGKGQLALLMQGQEHAKLPRRCHIIRTIW